MMDATVAKPIRAFEVTEDYEGHCEVVFSRHAIAARRVGASNLDTDFDSVTCRRARWADQYAASGRIPAAACIARGWDFEECSGCGAGLDEYALEERGLTIDRVHGALGGLIFCCVECAADDQWQREARDEFGQKILQQLRARVRARFGDVEFVTGPWREHVYVTDDMLVEQAVVSFSFPGQKYGEASLRWDNSHFETHGGTGPGWPRRRPFGPAKPEWLCCNGDREAFETWAVSLPATSDPNPVSQTGERG